MKTVAYCRVSTNKDEQLDSLESQRSFFLEYAKRYDYDLVHIYADEGKSGTRIKNRLQLQQLLNDANENKFELVLIKDVSRLARNTVDFLTSIRKLKSYGIKVLFVNYDQTSSESSEFMLTMLSAIAQEESANTSKRVKFGKMVNAEKGRVPNLCYGYNKTNGDYFNLDINEEEAKVVRKIFKMYSKEGMGTGKIAKLLNEKGIRTKRDYEWTQTGVNRILRNQLYTGKIINQKEEVVDFLTGQRVKNDEDKWVVVNKAELQIVSDETFNKANDILEKRRSKYKKTKRRTSDKYIFSKLIWCKQCGHHYRRIVRTYKNTYVRWVCDGRNSNGADSCTNKTTIDEDELLSALKEYAIVLMSKKAKYGTYITSGLCKQYEKRNNDLIMEEDYKRKISRLQKEKNKYIILYKEDIISLSELQTFIDEIQDNLNYINNELNLINNNISKLDILEKFALDLFYNLELVLEKHQFTNAEVKRFIEKIVVDKGGIINIYLVDINNNKAKIKFV